MVMGAWGLHGAVDGAAGGNNRLMTMGQLLGEMKSKAVRECEETVRQICSSLNGIAGLKLLQHEVVFLVCFSFLLFLLKFYLL